MKSEQEIRDRLAKVDADERYHYPTANTFTNAPLALVQLSLETEAEILAWVLGESAPKQRRKP